MFTSYKKAALASLMVGAGFGLTTMGALADPFPFGGPPATIGVRPADDPRQMLPLAGLPVGQVRAIWERLSREEGIAIKEETFAQLRDALSREPNVEQLGLFPRLVDRREIPGIIRAMWQTAAQGGHTKQMLDVVNSAVERSVSDAIRRAGPELTQLEERLNAEVSLGRINPGDEKAVDAFVQANASPALKSSTLWTWIGGFNFDLGGNVKCEKGSVSKNWKYRTLRACGGYIYGEIGRYILGVSINAGLVGIGAVAVHFGGVTTWIPEQANSLNVNYAWGTNTRNKNVSNTTVIADASAFVFTTVPSYKAFCGNSMDTSGNTQLNISSVCKGL